MSETGYRFCKPCQNFGLPKMSSSSVVASNFEIIAVFCVKMSWIIIFIDFLITLSVVVWDHLNYCHVFSIW